MCVGDFEVVPSVGFVSDMVGLLLCISGHAHRGLMAQHTKPPNAGALAHRDKRKTEGLRSGNRLGSLREPVAALACPSERPWGVLAKTGENTADPYRTTNGSRDPFRKCLPGDYRRRECSKRQDNAMPCRQEDAAPAPRPALGLL